MTTVLWSELSNAKFNKTVNVRADGSVRVFTGIGAFLDFRDADEAWEIALTTSTIRQRSRNSRLVAASRMGSEPISHCTEYPTHWRTEVEVRIP